jgi:RNA-directed DNA polymerase
MPTLLSEAEGDTASGAHGEPLVDPAQSKTLSMRGNSSHGNREIPSSPATGGVSGRPEKATSRTSGMHGDGKSDGCIVPQKPPNQDGLPTSAEGVEGRQPTEGNTLPQAPCRTQSRVDGLSGLQRVREAARKDKRARFTALLHHVTVDLLRDSFFALKRQAAPGVDGLTWPEYEDGLDDRLVDLHRRVHTGTYRAQPSKRAYIPKPDGRKRPLGIAALEDKVVQQAVVTVLNQIYEVDFLGFSYGLPPRTQRS